MSMQKPVRGVKLVIVGICILLVIGLLLTVFVSSDILVESLMLVSATILLGVFLFLIINQTPWSNNVLPILTVLFPIIEVLLSENKRRLEVGVIVDKMEYTLYRYNLLTRLEKSNICQDSPNRYTFSSRFREELINALFREKDKQDIIARCSNLVSKEMQPSVSQRILTLFYRDLHETPIEMEYEDFLQRESLRLELAEILCDSGLLPDKEVLAKGDERLSRESLLEQGLMPTAKAIFPYTKADLDRILRHYRKFELVCLVNDMRKLREIWILASNYLAFLVRNKALDDEFVFTVTDLIDSIEIVSDGLPAEMRLPEKLDRKATLALNVLKQVGFRGLRTSFGSMPASEQESLNLIALGIFFTEERKDLQDLRSAICQEASRDELALYQYLAYLEYREDLRKDTTLDGLNFVSVRYIAEHWKQTVERRSRELGSGFDKEIWVIRENLASGNWWSHLPLVIVKALEEIREQTKAVSEKLEEITTKRPSMGQVLRRIFNSLKLETIERFIEARTVTAYLLTFDGLEGSMANLIDCLSFFKGQKYRACLTRLGVCFTYRDREKYIFKDYIKQCRIGLIPQGMRFDEFVKQFEHDLIIAYENRKILELPNAEVDKFEVIVHRFGLSGRDRQGLEGFNPDGQRPHAIPRVRELLAESLFEKDIIPLVCYERSLIIDDRFDVQPILDDILVLGTIADFVADKISLMSEQERALLKNDQVLKSNLLRKMGRNKLRDFAQALGSSTREQDRAIDVLTSLLVQYSFGNDTAKLISAEYIETLAEIGALYY